MEIATAYYGASGPAHVNCFYLAQRYNKEWGYKPREGECWIVANRVSNNQPVAGLPFGTGNWLTGCWRSENGTLWVSDAFQQVLCNRRIQDEDFGVKSFETYPVEASLHGIWGVSDACVFTWGTRFDKGAFSYPVFQWNGNVWKEMPTPGFEVMAMHGLAPDFVYAVGHDTGIALWNGSAWRRWAAPGPELLTSVFVASQEEAYAVGVHGSVLQGSPYGWAKIAQSPFSPIPLSAVAKWQEQLWVGGGTSGLLRRVGKTDQLEVVKPNVHAIGFDARHELVISCSDRISGTADGVNFSSIGQGTVLKMRAGRELNQF